MTYKGRNDRLVVGAFALTTIAFVVSGSYWMAAPLAIIFVLCMLPQTYQLAPDGVYVNAGLVRRFIPYAVITFVGPCSGGRNLALALDGVCLKYGLNSEIRIAPTNAPGFIQDVASRSPHLVKRGHDLVLTVT